MCSKAGIVGSRFFGREDATLFERYKDGGFAEYIRVPYWLVDPLPDNFYKRSIIESILYSMYYY